MVCLGIIIKHIREKHKIVGFFVAGLVNYAVSTLVLQFPYFVGTRLKNNTIYMMI